MKRLTTIPALLLAGSITGCGTDSAPTDPDGPVEYTLAVEVSGTGTGTVRSQPSGIDCGAGASLCSAVFERGTQVTLTAEPATGMTFAGWTAGCAGQGPCALTMNANASVGARFENPALASGQVGPAGGELTSADGTLRLIVPAGALAQATTLTIETLDPAGLGAPFEGLDVAAAFELGPDGLDFLAPVTVEVATDQQPVLDAGSAEAELEFLLTSDDGAPAVLDAITLRVDVPANAVTLTGELTHFSPLARIRIRFPNSQSRLKATVDNVPASSEIGQPEVLTYEVRSGRTEIASVEADDGGSIFFKPVGASPFQLTEVAPTEFFANRTFQCMTEGDGTFVIGFAATLRAQQPAGVPSWMTGRTLITHFIWHRVRCDAAQGPPVLTPGLYPTIDLKQPFRLSVLALNFHGLTSSVRTLALGGEKAGGEGVLIVFDPVLRAILLERALSFYAWGVIGAVAHPQGAAAAAVLFAWGSAGYALFPGSSPFADSPAETRTDIRVDDAIPVGGGEASDAIVFASRDLGVGFIRYDATLGRFATSAEVLPASQFFGTVISAYAHTAGGPALVLARSSSSRLYFHPRGGGSPVVVASGLGSAVNGLRCMPPICLVFPSPGAATPVFRFDGQSSPVRLADAALGFAPIDASFQPIAGGGVAALLVGLLGGSRRVVEAEFDANGALLRTLDVAIPQGCLAPSGVAYVPDGAGAAILATCTSSDHYFVARSQILTSAPVPAAARAGPRRTSTELRR